MSNITPKAFHAPHELVRRAKALAKGDTSKLLGRETWNSLRIIFVPLILCGIIYPLLVFVIGQLAFNFQANGSLMTDKHGQMVGSELIEQQFTNPAYFHGRPSAVGYNAGVLEAPT
jgi:potassium-transporting ATPase KdpC subunit